MFLWHALLSGDRCVANAYSSECGYHLDLTRPVTSAKRLRVSDALALEQLLLGTPQNVIALQDGLAPATISARIRRAVSALGLLQHRQLPTALVVLVQAAHGLLPPEAVLRVEPCAGSVTEIVTVSRPNVDELATLSSAERTIVKSLLDGCARRDLPIVRERRPRTIANQIGSIYRKLKLSGRIPLISYVIRKVGCSSSNGGLTRTELSTPGCDIASSVVANATPGADIAGLRARTFTQQRSTPPSAVAPEPTIHRGKYAVARR